jgi:hypothetical protein
LKYIFGHINASDGHDQCNNEIQLHIPALKSLVFVKLQSLISMCPKQYQTTFPALEKIELNECSQVDVKSIGDFTFLTSISRYLGSTTIKVCTPLNFHVFFINVCEIYYLPVSLT